MSLLTSIFGSSKASYSPEARELVAHMRYELIPLKSLDQAIADLPHGAPVSVTCSP